VQIIVDKSLARGAPFVVIYETGRRLRLHKSVRVLVLLVPALLTQRPAPAAAEPGGRDEAQRLRDHGAAALDRGDAATASEDFRRAYELFPSPNLLYNLGLALDQLGRCVEAVDAFETFLDRAPDAMPQARSFAATRLGSIEGCVARLELTVAPADARVAVDGRVVALPRARALPIAPGDHAVTVEKAGFVARVEHLTVAAGQRRAWSVTLLPAPVATAPSTTDHAGRAALVGSRPAAAPPAKRPKGWVIGVVVGSVVAAGLAVGLGVGLGMQTDPKATFGVAGVQ